MTRFRRKPSLAVAYWAKRAGAAKVVVQASSNRRAEVAGELGADLFVQAQKGVAPARSARAALGGAPDVVFECVGLPGMIDQAIATVRSQGMVIILGACMEHDQWTPVVGLSKEVDIRFSLCYDLREYQVSIDAMDAGGIAPRAMITDTVPLQGLADACEALRGLSHQCKGFSTPGAREGSKVASDGDAAWPRWRAAQVLRTRQTT